MTPTEPRAVLQCVRTEAANFYGEHLPELGVDLPLQINAGLRDNDPLVQLLIRLRKSRDDWEKVAREAQADYEAEMARATAAEAAVKHWQECYAQSNGQRNAAEEKLAEAREVIEPFAAYRGSDKYLESADDDSYCAAASFKVGDYRRARNFLSKEPSDG